SNFVRINRTLKYATKLIAPDKILLGMASSGVDFNTDTHKAVDGRRPDLVAKGAGKITETKDAMGGTYSYADESGNHVVYFETDEGVRARLLTMYRYNLGGASYFYLGSPHDTIPNTATQFSVYKPEILNAIRANLVPIKYRSFYNTPIRRAEFCDLIAAFIEAKTGASINDYLTQKGVKVNANAFKDTKNANVLAANALGIVTGKGNGTFGLGTITRQEAAAMLTRLAKCFSYKPTSAPINFTEVAKLDNWASDSIKYISSISDPTNNKRVMNGTGNGRFSPYGSYTREQSYMTLIRLFHVLSQ
ncbi:MAG: S-layer homology domain-containing protein, partial [Clostridia bacterium]